MNSVGGVGGKGNKKITESSSTKSNNSNNNSSNNSSSNETSSNKSAKENTNTNNAVGASSVAAAAAVATGQSNSSSTTANNNNGKNWETNSATGNSANDALNPLKLTFTTIEHKIRNLEKRKVSFFCLTIRWICGRSGGVCVYSCVSVFMWVSVAKKDKREQIAEKRGVSLQQKWNMKKKNLLWTEP